MYKYGISYRTIRFWQSQAQSLRFMVGHKAFRSIADEFNYNYQNMSARRITEILIMLAETDNLGMIGFGY